ncbi:hypothetical protein LX77_03889 [Gelidibacter algens]|uniref:Lipocalin-like protein n=1 Tax=Gelidibacter algens TaxID=49280 RepID=A0A1A7R1I1_9FLAO|nr:hypothetical protein [Gelidibacter algens]OBX26110.1 hypothetical protein A9996_06165 [Gelidibacter algens]RAJ17362.1 hypothetical protein LX77_03889 [Gelidibacter algens]
MKKLNILLVVLITFFSCSKDDQNSMKNYQGKWKLTQMTGSIPNSETTGSEMEWQEFYLLNTDGTFKKSRERNGILTEISGTNKVVNSSNENLLEFIYASENEIIGTCYSDILKEEMYFQSKSILISNWEQCDGPGLKYEKVN